MHVEDSVLSQAARKAEAWTSDFSIQVFQSSAVVQVNFDKRGLFSRDVTEPRALACALNIRIQSVNKSQYFEIFIWPPLYCSRTLLEHPT